MSTDKLSNTTILSSQSSKCLETGTSEVGNSKIIYKILCVRFIVSIIVLVTLDFCLILATHLALHDSILTRMLASIIVPVTAFFGYEWSFIHSLGLTRKTRAFWNESNILLTYQPRARFEGYKFKPDPPTPGPNLPPRLLGSCVGNALQEQLEEEGESVAAREKKEAFEASRNAHYANEFQAALKGELISDLPLETHKMPENMIDSLAAAGSPLTKIDDSAMKPVSEKDIPSPLTSFNSEIDKSDAKINESKSSQTAIDSPTMSEKNFKKKREKLQQNKLKPYHP